MRKIVVAIGAWIVAVTAAHFALNVNWQVLMNDRLPEATRKLNVAYIPVT
jgi:putative salt-induced outer membrane protein YdiY